MSTWLTDEWFDQTRGLAAGQPERPGLSARMQFVVTGGPDGDVRYFWVLEDGQLRQSGLGEVDGPDVTLTTARTDALEMARGTLDPNVAFMQGKMKVAGSMGIMMRLLPVTNTPEYQDLRRQIADVTEF
ncbi:MAG TPA: SCP2 sterol-binding domain-containing protein [Acidimicrobiales bacterium]|nr:SCP2 sterol-binding domain-containing protein [Acidimicrobiales bacterium]